MVTLGVVMSGRTFFLKDFGVQAHSAGGVQGSPLWLGSFPERRARKEALGIHCVLCLQIEASLDRCSQNLLDLLDLLYKAPGGNAAVAR